MIERQRLTRKGTEAEPEREGRPTDTRWTDTMIDTDRQTEKTERVEEGKGTHWQTDR